MIRWSVLLPVLACLALGLMAGLGAAEIARRQARGELAVSAEADARIRQALLESEVARYRLLPLALADDRDVIAAERAGAGSGAPIDTLNEKLERLARATGAAAIYVVDRDSLAIAASNWRQADSFVGSDYAFRRYVRDAQRKGAGQQFALGTVSHKPGLFLAQRTRSGGVVVVKLEFDWIEAQWRQAGGITYVTNRSGVIFVTSRPDWRFAATRALDEAQRSETVRDSGALSIHPSPWSRRKDGLLSVPGTREGYLQVETARDADGWQLHLALPASASIDGQARLVGFAVGIAMLALALFALWFVLRSRRRRLRTSELEAAVVARTAELRDEMEQRSELESRAAQLREELRLANRLATLGQVTASVAHETAQPVAAIRNYAAAGRKLLERGLNADVDGNLAAIDALAERIGVVTSELRGFARKRTSAGTRTVLAEALDGARLLLRDRLSDVTLRAPVGLSGITVVGDKVRIEQILVNLLQNALDALAGRAAPCIEIAVRVEGERAVITVCDNGPGIAPQIAERLFTPFTTSRDEGLGLGLVIAQDIATEFGGSLRVVPGEEIGLGRGARDLQAEGRNGACFELVLRISK
ncbi:sensor histidine kinase [Novosphingobium profundi]|uniref:sensor histidine kinase n=1 Tax=Novosphingobium profundi TaxID=1774954 RepID=UPI001BD9F0DC|nr:ATP-binding protein [Novosphingobium profundi]MBT0667649.1 sensor histidine kinase [Novosphingobium profundi]